MKRKTDFIYFLGIGGIGMSALARYFNKQGASVAGYDKTPSPLTDDLIAEGINIHFEDDITQIPASLALAIYTPAVPNTNKEYTYLKASSTPFVKRSHVLGLLTQNKTTYAIAGTHGKTSTTALLTHLLYEQRAITAFIGGIALNFNSNFVASNESEIFIVEADEYDRSFLALAPDIAVITAMDADHLDIYGNSKELIKSFNEFVKNIKTQGVLLIKPELVPHIMEMANIKTYSLDDTHCDYYAKNIRIEHQRYYFDMVLSGKCIEDIAFGVQGLHNIENAVVASAVAHMAGIDTHIIKQQLESYRGVKRRFEYVIRRDDFIYIDDYAHHPQEIKACIASAKLMHPNRKICGVFQPHLYSRTRDFADEFARSLELLDHIILLPIYPARELPIEGIDANILLDKINNPEKIVLEEKQLMPYIESLKPELLITMGAGDIDRLVSTIKTTFDHE
jgi:UDP-N-acetylmuramate--alanine ligase